MRRNQKNKIVMRGAATHDMTTRATKPAHDKKRNESGRQQVDEQISREIGSDTKSVGSAFSPIHILLIKK